MTHKVVGNLVHDGETFGHGDSVTAGMVGGEENLKHLQAIGTVVTTKEFNDRFPEQDSEVIPVSGTPSNLRQVTGTKLEAPTQSTSSESDKAPSSSAAQSSGTKDSGNTAKAASSSTSSTEKK